MNSAKSLLKNIVKYQIWYAKTFPKFFILGIISIAGEAALPFASVYSFGQILNNIVLVLNGGGVIDNIIKIVILQIFISILLSICYKLQAYIDQRSYLEITRKVTFDYIKKVSNLDLAKFEDNKFVLKYNKSWDVADYRLAQFIANSTGAIYSIIQLVIAIITVSAINPLFIIVVIISLVPNLLADIRYSKKTWGIWELKGDKKTKYYDLHSYLTNRHYLNEVRIFDIGNKLFSLLKETYDSFLGEQRKTINQRFVLKLFAEATELIGYYYILINLLYQVLAKNIQIGTFTFLQNSVDKLSSSTNGLLTSLGSLYDHILYINDFEYIMNLKNEIVTLPNAYKLNYRTPRIEFRNVSFHYPGTDKLVFDDLNIVINPGEDIALVGENGAGKTTFVKLLTRIYDVSSGEILIDGKNLKEIDLATWYANLGTLSQNFNSYALTVKENITLGGNDEINTVSQDERIQRAVKLAECDEMIESLDKKYEQILSKAYEGGTDLSGGQWQRIALARAFYRDPNVLILDEPTSAIDAKAEYQIFNNILTENNFKTTVIISHRFSTVRNADKIYVIDKGKIVESGTHEDLMNLSGKYKEMFELQAKGYE